MLEHLGLEVHEAVDGLHALEQLEAGDYHVLVTDILLKLWAVDRRVTRN